MTAHSPRALRLAGLILSAILGFVAVVSTGPAGAADFGRTPPPKPPGHDYAGGGRVGGDTIDDAVLIPALPFADSGATCGYVDDYDEICPYSGSTSPDVVYRLEPLAEVSVTIDLCASGYDTKVYVWEDAAGQEIACNDDAGCGYSGYQSRILFVNLSAGHTYYVVVDGYGGDCGEYALTIDEYVPCDLVCPAGAQIEGEPPCADQYYDTYNAGCSGSGGYLDDWQPIYGDESGCGAICGRSCTFLYNGLSYRDTDWYRVGATGGTLTYESVAEFPFQAILIHGTYCANLQYIFAISLPCEPIVLEWDIEIPRDIWLWVGPSVFSGVTESEYILHVCGIGPVVSPTGACCIGAACSITFQVLCDYYYDGIWGGPDVSCLPNPCYQTGACCLADGSCVLNEMDDCWLLVGDWLFPVATCEPNPCGPTPVEPTSWGALKNRYR